jgi:hypothetical protein
MQTQDRSRSPSRTTIDDVVFAITLSAFAASLTVLVASALTEGPAPTTLAAGAEQCSPPAGTC